MEFSSFGFLNTFYGLYFGVLGRDCAEMCVERMASTTGFMSRKGECLPSFDVKPNICAICSDILSSDNNSKSNERLFKLNCSHQFHEFCIRGWTMIGKKDTCPRCSEKVSLKETFKNPWDQHGIIWGKVLNLLRYLVA